MSATYLFVPAHDTRKVRRALASAADVVILDLEDGVPAASKDAARAAVNEMASSQPAGPARWVRVNAATSDAFERDVAEVDWRVLAGAVLPKAEQPAAIAALTAAGVREILPLVETVTGLRSVRAMARASDCVHRLAIGALDLAVDLGLTHMDDPDDSELIWHVRRELALESRSLGLAGPVDGVFTRLGDLAGLRAACDRARDAGFGGKLLIHPEQIPIARAVFTADPARVSEARALLAAAEAAMRDGQSVLRFGERMVDAPVIARARAVVAAAEDGAEGHRR